MTTLSPATFSRAAQAGRTALVGSTPLSEVHCAHCSLPVPAGLVRIQESGELEQTQFCCHGCETAFSIIQGCGLDRYYELRDSLEASTGPAAGTGGKFSEFDDPTFASLYVRVRADGVRHTELLLQGVHCAACVWLVEKLPRIVPGVLEARLDMRRRVVSVAWDPALPLSTIARALDRLGYPPHPARSAEAARVREREARGRTVDLAVAGACAANAMLLAIALYAGLFDAMDQAYATLFRWTSMVAGVVAIAWPGRVFIRGAIASIRARSPHVDLPVAIGIVAGGVWSVVSTLTGEGEIYFDSVSVLVFALLVGRAIQRGQEQRAASAVEMLFCLTPTLAHRLGGETPDGSSAPDADVHVEALKPGDLVEIRAGESAPVDGVIEQGISELDRSLLTGESRPARVCPGDAVAAGEVNLRAAIRVRTIATGEDTRVGRLMKLVEECSRRRAPIVQLADRLSAIFVWAMLGLALLTLAIWLVLDPSSALGHAAAMLIVTCPCALGLATPLTLTAAIGKAAAAGAMIKGGDVVERLAGATRAAGKAGVVLLDKTGTITEGACRVVRCVGDSEALRLAAELEAHSSHVVARALVAAFAGGGEDDQARRGWTNVHEHTGAGIEGVVRGIDAASVDGPRSDGPSVAGPRLVRVGSRRWIESSESLLPADADARPALALSLASEHDAMLAEGLSPVLVSIDGEVRAIAAIGDPPRSDAAASIARLREMGWSVRVLSGDHPEIVRAVGGHVGIDPVDCLGGRTPEDKLEHVREELSRSGGRPVVMVGDGVNDAAALSAASVGVAVRGGAEASLAAADVHLRAEGLTPLIGLFVGATRTMRVIRWSLAVSIFYNAFAAAMAVTGLISPVIAAILMPVSSISVITLAFRSRTFTREEASRA
ncbi:MAG: heavy metal translocating P-type ATPase [Planctomycetota bacterium]|nr:heavy metal translocating P-type ATPase [Planctomycetota bacterium]